jgi:hypothetical protein
VLDPFVPSFKLLRFDKSIWDLTIVKLEGKKLFEGEEEQEHPPKS